MGESRYEYDNFKVDPPRVDDGWYLVKDGMTYRVDLPIDKMRFTKSINILTGEVYYPSNYDRLRSMSAEEMAEFLAEYRCVHKAPHCREANCEQCWLDWLKQEVSTNG